MGQTQLKGLNIADGSIQREDLNTTTSGKAVVRKIADEAGTGIRIKSSTGVDKGTGDVVLELDTAFMADHYVPAGSEYSGWTVKGGKSPVTGNTLYNHYVVEDARGICPAGWHVPTAAEFITLSNALGGDSVAGGHLKATGTVFWDAPNTGADDSSGFGARAVGYRDDTGVFWSAKLQNAMWTSTSCGGGNYYCSFMTYNLSLWYPNGGTLSQRYGLQIRLIKDNSTDPGTLTDYDGHVYQTVKIGNQVWMKQDLIVTHFNNGDVIPVVTNASAWAALTTVGTCFYNNGDTATDATLPVGADTVVEFIKSDTLSFKVEVVGGVIKITGFSVNTPGEPGSTGPTGNFTTFLFAKNTSSTAAPSLTVTDVNPALWTAAAPATGTGEYLWMITTIKSAAGALVTNWNAAVRIKGDKGDKGDAGDPQADNSVTYAKMATEFKGDLTITANAIDWSSGWYKAITLSTNTTYTFTNLEKGKVIHLKITGSYAITWPSGCIVINGGTYNGAKQNDLYIECVSSSSPEFKIAIQTEP